MATPSTPARSRDTDGAAQFSRDTEPTFPTILQRTKRQRGQAVLAALDRLQHPGKVAGEDTTAQTFLGRHLDDLNQNFLVNEEVFTKLGLTLDEFAAGYRGDNQREHKATTRHHVSMVLEVGTPHHEGFDTQHSVVYTILLRIHVENAVYRVVVASSGNLPNGGTHTSADT
ncbi:hypothetical protein E4U59_004078 [Claviceps monticola]|nr:hypothetical protein E4U59_004078 [Claviceps monticola]